MDNESPSTHPPDDPLQRAGEKERQPAPPRPAHPEVQYERTDASLRPVIIVAIVFCCLLAAGIYVVYEFQSEQQRRLRSRSASEFPLVQRPSTQLPAAPRLEPLERVGAIPGGEFFQQQVRQEQALHGYGKGGEAGFFHVPIERAIAALAGKLPVRKETPPNDRKDNGLVDAGEPNSGRLLRERP